jgi:RNase P subunit RPR2
MPEIIGKNEAAYKFATCKQCASLLKYTFSERRQDFDTDYTGSRDYYAYILCPCCGKQVRVP